MTSTQDSLHSIGISSILDDAVATLVAAKPEDPLLFLANLFQKAHKDKILNSLPKRQRTEGTFDFDLIVIGGGSGGMAAAKEAAHCGGKVALFDFVKPSTQGTKWGLGGTCVNVGCVPKKLMHFAGLFGCGLHHDAAKLGWEIPEGTTHSWSELVGTVQNHIRSLNFAYKNGLRSAKVTYMNNLASLAGPHTVKYEEKDGTSKTITSRYILIAVGGRPHIPSDISGAVQHCITSDDLFSLQTDPGKVLVVGASYIALECAGFLQELQHDVTVAVRSIFLRGFDQQCAGKIATVMRELGTHFLHGVTPTSINKTESGKLEVLFSNGTSDTYDTVLYATGRKADLADLGLDSVGLIVSDEGKLEVNNEETAVSDIFAVGDVVKGAPELTPVAIRAGEMLARRLFANSSEVMDYSTIPTTVFTPAEYGCCGLSEEAAEKKYGKENIEVYLFEFSTLEHAAMHRKKAADAREDEYDTAMGPSCLSKLVCLRAQPQKVVGFHFVGPNAGEMTQGFALSLRMGATKADFDAVVGIHPTDAEAFTSLSITRSSGLSWIAAGGCGGGKCG